MCVRTIIDACAFRHFLEVTPRTAGHQLRCWILRGDGLVVYCGDTRYGDELKANKDVLKIMGDWEQRGLSVRIDAELVRTEEKRIPAKPIRRSDDPHVLALAAASGATVLFSCDFRLQDDFANSRVIPKVGNRRRRSLPLRINEPKDTTNARRRRRFLDYRRCETVP